MSTNARIMRMRLHGRGVVTVAALMVMLAHALWAQPASGGATSSGSIQVVIIAKKGWIQEVVDAAKDAGSATAPVKIPITVLKGITLRYLFGRLGAWLLHAQICQHFDQWMLRKEVGATGIITVEFLLVSSTDETPGPGTPRITVDFWAKKTGQNTPTGGNSGGVGILVPIDPSAVDPKKNPTGAVMQYDVFGDGSYVIPNMECPMPK